ncbi:MAG: hypothetical protein FWC98_01635 [Bacteroidales bacterium]|nr:hypothetical protein [Bacteroidales bacterium]
MKKLKFLLFAIAAMALVLQTSCSSDDPTAEIRTAPVLQPFEVGEITYARLTETVSVTVTAPEVVGTSVPVIYTLFAVSGENQEAIGTGSPALTQQIPLSAINEALLKLEVFEGPTNVGFFIQASVADLTRNSANVIVEVTPYIHVAGPVSPLNVNLPLFLVGNVLGDRDNSDFRFIFFRDNNNSPDIMATNFSAGNFKVALGMDDLGSDTYLTGSAAPGILAARGQGNDIAMTAGSQMVTIGLNSAGNRVYTIEPFDATGAPTYGAIRLIGAAVGGWGDGDQVDLTQSSYDPNIWYGTVEINPGELRFRADNNWDLAWSSAGFPFGRQATPGSGTNTNVPAPALYFVKFNSFTGHYVFLELESRVIDPSTWSVEIHGDLDGTGWHDHFAAFSSELTTITNPANNAGTFVWTIENIEILAGSEFGTRIAGSWFNGAAIEITGDTGNFSGDGNVSVENTQTYNVTFTIEFNGVSIVGRPVVNFAPVQ